MLLVMFYILISVKYCVSKKWVVHMKDIQMIEPDFWMGRGRYSKRALREAAVDNSPIEKTGEEAGGIPEETNSPG